MRNRYNLLYTIEQIDKTRAILLPLPAVATQQVMETGHTMMKQGRIIFNKLIINQRNHSVKTDEVLMKEMINNEKENCTKST